MCFWTELKTLEDKQKEKGQRVNSGWGIQRGRSDWNGGCTVDLLFI